MSKTDMNATRWRSLCRIVPTDKESENRVEIPSFGHYGFYFGRRENNDNFELNFFQETIGMSEKKLSNDESSCDINSSNHCGCTYRAIFTHDGSVGETETMTLPMESPSAKNKLLGSTRMARIFYLPKGSRISVEAVKQCCKGGINCQWVWGLVQQKNFEEENEYQSHALQDNKQSCIGGNSEEQEHPPSKKAKGEWKKSVICNYALDLEKIAFNPPGIGKKLLLCTECCKKCLNAQALRSHYISIHAPKLGELGTTEYDDLIGTKIFRTLLKTAYEDDEVVIVVKPQGIPVQGGAKWSLMRSDLLMPFRSKLKRIGDLAKPRIAHRLDSATGGLLVCVKTSNAERAVKGSFASRRCKKRYRAIVFGKVIKNQHQHCKLDDDDQGPYAGMGVIRAPLQGGKDSITRYSIVSYTACDHPLADGFITTIDLYPVTGRKHQLRRHLKLIGHPIWGDMRHGPYSPSDRPDSGNIDDPQQNPHRLMCLWALEITLPHPSQKEMIHAVIKEPEWYEKLRKIAKNTKGTSG